MTNLIKKMFGNIPDEPVTEKDSRVIGKIIKLQQSTENGGYGFISSKDIPFTRIFFHWSALTQDTLNFLELREGMQVEFTPIEIEDKGWRALRVKVIDNE